jgi:hypothetical protein
MGTGALNARNCIGRGSLNTNELDITCPKCKTAIPITEAVAGPLLASKQTEFEQRVREIEEGARREHAAMEAKERTLETTISQQVAEREKSLRNQIELSVRQSMERDFAQEQSIAVQAQQEAQTLRDKLAIAQQAQAAAVRKERELAEREGALELTIENKVTTQLDAFKQRARSEADEANRLKLLEKDTLLASMQAKIAELQQKAEQGSQQLQGEVQEIDLEESLRRRFPFDQVTEIAKGVNGADVSQIVRAPSGTDCGVILYESKRTKNWSAGWLPKLREDGRRAKADILILVSQVVPPEVEGFDYIDSVWVCEPKYAAPLSALVRESLLRVHVVKQAQQGMATKSELVYGYLTGPLFRSRIEAVVEAFTTMTDDLEKEKRAVTRQWAQRAAQIERVMNSTTGLFGDLQGISGSSIPEIESISMKALEG